MARRRVSAAARGLVIGTKVFTDSFRRLALRSAEANIAAGATTHLYRFDLPTTVLSGVLRSTHGCDIAFILNSLTGAMMMHEPEDATVRHLAATWSTAIATFARSGDPGYVGLPSRPAYTSSAAPCLTRDRRRR